MHMTDSSFLIIPEMKTKWDTNEEIQRFREYLRIKTVHPNVIYDECITFLKKQAKQLDLPIELYFPSDQTKPVAVITRLGTDISLPSIFLNSHMDVVPVFDNWKHPPFEAEIDENGNIYARGAQDMKSVGMQYLGAIKILKDQGIRLKRTVHVAYLPDEEIGSEKGMKAFVKSEAFRLLNVGMMMDEGIATQDEKFIVYYSERSQWVIHVICYGTTGHGSMLYENTAAEKIRHVIDQFMNYRSEQVAKLEENPSLTIGDVTSVNLTMLEGGIQGNVVPSSLKATFDVRLAIDVDHNEFERMVNTWCEEAGSQVKIEYGRKQSKAEPTAFDDTNPFWKAFQETMVDDLQLTIQCLVCPARGDSFYVREVGIPSIQFSPLNHTPLLLHDNDEHVSAEVYLNGIKIYEKLIQKIANV